VSSREPTGLARRRRRLSDAESERRMLEAATALVNETGLTVSLEHISLEEVIRAAGVSRSAAYRRWPYKDLFFSDLLKELARAASPGILDDSETLELVRQIVAEHSDWLATPESRNQLVLELIRQAALRDFEWVLGSKEWRTYLALHATFLSLADGELRDELQAILAHSEEAFVARIAEAWRRMADLLGLRLRPEVGATYETLASLLSTSLRGLVLMALATPDVATRRITARPFGTGESSEWSLVALAAASIAYGLLEPDPAFTLGEERLAAIRGALESVDLERVVVPLGDGPA